MKKKGSKKRRAIATGKKINSFNRKTAKTNAIPSQRRSIRKKEIVSPKKIAAKKAAGIKPFPIVGIGGSAGALEAFSTLLENLPVDLGMAYVYVQHLSPTHESFLPEILQRKTKMNVLKVTENIQIEKDNVYVIPAKYHITIADGTLHLKEVIKGEPLNSIDTFFSSLAPLYQENAIGILLSGTGIDGTAGLMSIKVEGGITFAQDESAGYQDMPNNATERGYVDFVLSPAKMATELASLIKQPYAVTTANEFFNEQHNDLRMIHMIMYTKRGVDFSNYKQTTINRRIMRRMALNRLQNIEAYAKLLRNSKREVDALYQDMLIVVTNFFRDPVMYQALADKILPALLKERKQTEGLRIWIPGCATGEEAISFAIVILEHLGEKVLTMPIQIFATDLNEKAIERARAGIYTQAALQNVSQQRLKRFFVKVDGHYQVIKTIRDMCVFAPHNLIKDPPFSRMDIISCQNLLIYLEARLQVKVMHTFHYALKADGYLLLGKSETTGNAADLFEQLSKHYKIYRKRKLETPLRLDFHSQLHPADITNYFDEDQKEISRIKEPDFDKETEKLLLNRYTPASVLVNKDLEIVRFRGSTSRYLEPASGKASLNLLKMVKEDIAFDLRTILYKAKKEKRTAKKHGIITGVNGGAVELSIEVAPINGVGKDIYYLIIFQENGVATKTTEKTVIKKVSKDAQDKKIASLEAQLKDAKENLKMVTEDFEAAREELQSANEEVLSSNEELQSINEELETSREELQSTNEELTTINDELTIRNQDLKEAAEYSKVVVETMHESLIMLTADLRVKNANRGFYQAFHTTAIDTEGFYLYELGSRQWDIPELRKNLQMVQERDIPFIDFEVTHEFPGIGRKTMLLNAHKFPVKDGLTSVILLAIQDITSRKQMEEALRENEERFMLMVQNASDIITVFDKSGTIKYESPAIEPVLGFTPEERVGTNIIIDALVHPEDREIKLGLLRMAIENPHKNLRGEFRLRGKDGSYKIMDAIFRNLLDDPKINGIIANYRDVTERKKLEQQKDEFIGIASHELKTPVTSIKAYTQILKEVFENANDKESAEMLDKMNSQVDRLTTLIIDLLDFTRIEGGKLKFREEDYALNDLVAEVVEETQRTALTHKIEMKLDRSVHLWGDRYRTGQVLTNLISNAIKYSPKAKKILVNSNLAANTVTICVQDFGIGINKAHANKVFERFFRVSESQLNTFSGLGLGLYIASEIVKRQGGTISVKSKEGKGSTFCFTLPLKKS